MDLPVLTPTYRLKVSDIDAGRVFTKMVQYEVKRKRAKREFPRDPMRLEIGMDSPAGPNLAVPVYPKPGPFPAFVRSTLIDLLPESLCKGLAPVVVALDEPLRLPLNPPTRSTGLFRELGRLTTSAHAES